SSDSGLAVGQCCVERPVAPPPTPYHPALVKRTHERASVRTVAEFYSAVRLQPAGHAGIRLGNYLGFSFGHKVRMPPRQIQVPHHRHGAERWALRPLKWRFLDQGILAQFYSVTNMVTVMAVNT